MANVVLDTNLLSDFIASYYLFDIADTGEFQEHSRINLYLADKFNHILNNYRSYGTLEQGIVIASSFAFIEIARQFQVIADGRFDILKFKAFIDSPPEWFIIAPVSNELFPYLTMLPSHVEMAKGELLPIEWADAIHVATTLSREDDSLIAATDNRITRIPQLENRLIL